MIHNVVKCLCRCFHGLATYELHFEVLSCSEAADAKHIPLEHELKTLILITDLGQCALHVRGNKRASLRKVKKFLNVRQAYLASEKHLASLGLEPGTVCPLLNPVWKLKHLISKGAVSLDYVSTNNGTRSKYFIFSPNLLLHAADVSVGDFEA